MRFNRECTERQTTRDDHSGSDVQRLVMDYLESLPRDRRGAEAMRLSSQLLEFAAFELAGTLGSKRAGALIECAAKLLDPNVEAGETVPLPAKNGRRIIQ